MDFRSSAFLHHVFPCLCYYCCPSTKIFLTRPLRRVVLTRDVLNLDFEYGFLKHKEGFANVCGSSIHLLSRHRSWFKLSVCVTGKLSDPNHAICISYFQSFKFVYREVIFEPILVISGSTFFRRDSMLCRRNSILLTTWFWTSQTLSLQIVLASVKI